MSSDIISDIPPAPVRGEYGCGRTYETLSGYQRVCDSDHADLGFTGLCENCDTAWRAEMAAHYHADMQRALDACPECGAIEERNCSVWCAGRGCWLE